VSADDSAREVGVHRFETVVRLQHTDAAGVIFFARLFDLAHLAFEDLLDRIGHPLPPDLADAPVGYPIVASSAEYQAPLRLGDRVTIGVRIADVKDRSFALEYAFAMESGALAATARTVHMAAGESDVLPSGLAAALREEAQADE
jgi:YbgC/YbaW family acyl-CoA thioester hydrolase